jgi:hypothetical protein
MALNLVSVHWHNAKKIFDEEHTDILEGISPTEKVKHIQPRVHVCSHTHMLLR